MEQVEKYMHHGRKTNVISKFKGMHKELCLCHLNCIHYKPDGKNCNIAQELFEFDIAKGITTPVLECNKYE